MVIDTSAIVAVLLNEATAPRIAQVIETGSPRLLSAANLLEASIVIDTRKGDAGGRELDLLIYRAGIEIVAVDHDQAEIARIAWRRFGKGRPPAALNYGDCFAYALAKSRRLPLLYQGDDFSHTDVESVLKDTPKEGLASDRTQAGTMG
jgi:ribonuclease VapC